MNLIRTPAGFVQNGVLIGTPFQRALFDFFHTMNVIAVHAYFAAIFIIGDKPIVIDVGGVRGGDDTSIPGGDFRR